MCDVGRGPAEGYMSAGQTGTVRLLQRQLQKAAENPREINQGEPDHRMRFYTRKSLVTIASKAEKRKNKAFEGPF
jgi:hypothetical protein